MEGGGHPQDAICLACLWSALPQSWSLAPLNQTLSACPQPWSQTSSTAFLPSLHNLSLMARPPPYRPGSPVESLSQMPRGLIKLPVSKTELAFSSPALTLT